MSIKVIYDYENKQYEFKEKELKAKEILKKLNILSNTVLLKKNNKIITEEDTVKEGETLEIIRIISGG